mgnify:CR=1 FL=1
MKRRLAREIALQTLFQLEFSDITAKEAKQAVFLEREMVEDPDQLDYADTLIKGCTDNKIAIDDLIKQYATNWKIDRIDVIDRNILRIAIFELKFTEYPLANNIIINEAVEISKLYAGDNSSKFINGILGKLKNVDK